MKPFTETVILIEPDNVAMRAVTVTQRNVKEVRERLHINPLHPDAYTERLWRNTNDERDLTGQMRVFREVLPEPPKEEPENPIYDELKVKINDNVLPPKPNA